MGGFQGNHELSTEKNIVSVHSSVEGSLAFIGIAKDSMTCTHPKKKKVENCRHG